MNTFSSIVYIIFIFSPSIKSINIECDYTTGKWGTLGIIYYLDVKSSLKISSSENSAIVSNSGVHSNGKTNNDVIAFMANGKTIHRFPQGLNSIFKNLKAIQIYGSHLKEIHQSDFMFFPKLENLHFHNNDVQVLEEGLFSFNPNLTFINLDNNKIAEVHPDVFDHLSKLIILNLQSNICIDMTANYNSIAVQEIITKIKRRCPTPKDAEYLKTCLKVQSQVSSLSEEIEAIKKIGYKISLNIAEELKADVKITHNETLVSYGEKFEDIEERVDGIAKQIEDLKLSLKEVHVKVLNSINNQVDHLENKVNIKIQNLDDKINKILKAMNISV